MTAMDNLTVDACLIFCGNSDYAGLEYGRECWCGSSLNTNAAKLADANCSLRCDGDDTEICGGPLMLTVYQKKDDNTASTGGAVRVVERSMGALVLVLGLGVVLL